ncbi:MAG: ArsR family transcriptional regulator [Pelovirga sp.]
MEKSEVRRIEPEDARRRMDAGEAMLVCAYESDKKFQSMQLEGAESLNSLLARLPDIPKEQEIIFYCA